MTQARAARDQSFLSDDYAYAERMKELDQEVIAPGEKREDLPLAGKITKIDYRNHRVHIETRRGRTGRCHVAAVQKRSVL